jgi:Tfp pilus assembly protein PilV
MSQRGFALFDALLAVILMAIAAAGSYTLVKSFRANSATQQLIRYATNITQSFIPFMDGSASSTVLQGDKLSQKFLFSMGVAEKDQTCTMINNVNYCYVNAGMYVNSNIAQGAKQSLMGFSRATDSNGVNYFIIAVQATASQVSQMLQNTSSIFSIYCPISPTPLRISSQEWCQLPATGSTIAYSLFLVFPKSGSPVNFNAPAPPAPI